jgi:cytochrome c oxidase cbb3-type subunit 2
MFTNLADVDTAYAEQLAIKSVFKVPYSMGNEKILIPMEDGTSETVEIATTVAGANAAALEEAKAIVTDMKNQDVKDMVNNGQIPEIVALIAYLNSLK